MVLDSLRVFEGNNIKKSRRVIKISLVKASDVEVKSYLKAYFRICFLLGFKERLIDIERQESSCNIWVSYTQEEVSKYILYNIQYYIENVEKLAEKASGLVNQSLTWKICCSARKIGFPVIDLSEYMWQIGYGVNSIVISKKYQSYENMHYVEVSRDRKALWQNLALRKVPKVKSCILYSSEDVKELKEYSYPISIRGVHKSIDISISTKSYEELVQVVNNMMKSYTRVFVYEGDINYRCFCIEGECKAAFKLGENYIQTGITEEISKLCRFAYSCTPIEFMYIDLQVGDTLKVADLGSVMEIEGEIEEVHSTLIEMFLDFIVKMGVGNIPIVSVTGTNGKTTTARLIHKILNNLGINTGLTSTGGIFVGNLRYASGDTTGFLSARELLKNKNVAAAVLETARGGILRNGLGYENATAALITSLSEDHIGMEGIKNLKDLAMVKSTLFEEIEEKGKIIIKAQKELLELALLKKCAKSICLISNEKNELVSSHVKNGGEAFYVSRGLITFFKDNKETELISLREIPFTHDGRSISNIMNVMFAIAASAVVTGRIEASTQAVKKLQCDLPTNPGRQNIIDLNSYKIILDYGHNSEAFNEVFTIADALKPSKITSIIAAPGDRMNKYIEELGEIAAKFSNKIIIREQEDLRGRKQYESAGLLREGVLRTGFKEENLSIILKEEDAIISAMKSAEVGEVIVLFTQCLDIIIPAINKYLERIGKAVIGKGMDFSH